LLTPVQSQRLTCHVLRQAIADADDWARLGLLLSLSVNVTADDLMGPDLLALTRDRSPGESPMVILEITETAAMDDDLLGSEVAARLHLGGLEVSVDDFGVGFSSLSRPVPASTIPELARRQLPSLDSIVASGASLGTMS
ncbi:EAL domain-containing protein, partial [Halomonas sp.]|uniref:EAL domain-containing protein n=1 Tax=Halomonas sp. TaxID=1486246 RepID=UPI0035667BDA